MYKPGETLGGSRTKRICFRIRIVTVKFERCRRVNTFFLSDLLFGQIVVRKEWKPLVVLGIVVLEFRLEYVEVFPHNNIGKESF